MAGQKRPRKMSDRRRRLWYAGRRATWALSILIIAGVLILADRMGIFGARPVTDAERYDGKTFRAVNVVDGDTLDVDIPDKLNGYPTTRIRLWGVDTPETVKPDTSPQHFGHEAAAFTKKTALNQPVRIELEGHRTRDGYGRLLGYVYLPDGRMLNRLLVAEGFAYADPRFEHTRKSEFRRLQRQARKTALGLWKDVRPADLPYYYRGVNLVPQTQP